LNTIHYIQISVIVIRKQAPSHLSLKIRAKAVI
jgi:hypothetical protein